MAISTPTHLNKELPAPGEPLRRDIHPDNKKALAEELEARAARLSPKMGARQLRKLRKRYTVLHKQLNAASYNALVLRLDEFRKEYIKAKYEYSQENDRKKKRRIAGRGRAARDQGRALNAVLSKLSPLVTEFDDIGGRIRDHKSAREWEIQDRQNFQEFKREATVWEAQIKGVFRQSARLHHRVVKASGKDVIQIPQFEQIIFREDKVLFHIRTASQNVLQKMLKQWRAALPYNVDISDLTCDETLENLSAATNRVVTVERSKRGTNFFYTIMRMDSPDSIPRMLLYSKALQYYPTIDHEMTPWAGGVSDGRVVEWYNFEQHPHLLIVGTTLSGKSNLLNTIIATLVSMNSPKEVRLLLVDMKGGIEFTHWAGIKHELRPMIKRADDLLPALRSVRAIFDKRLEAFERIKAKNLSQFNRKVRDEDKVPRIVICIDEMATLRGLGELTTAIDKEMGDLAAMGRAVGIHIIVCTQHATREVVDTWVKNNMHLRISFKVASIPAALVASGSVDPFNLPSDVPGRAYFSQGRFGTVIQTPFISNDEVARAVGISTSYSDESLMIAPDIAVERFGREHVLDIVVNQLNFKLSPAAIHEKVDKARISLRQIRIIVESIVDEWEDHKEVRFNDHAYEIRRVGKARFLTPAAMEQTVEQENTLYVDNDEAFIRSIEDD